jgi:hypothetical protein
MASSNAMSPFAALGVKRKAFFSFHYDDIMRVNNARNSWKIDHPEAATMRTFYDGSLWESRKLNGPDALKRLIREGVQQTSAVCVLVGTHTWARRWVRYEIARAIIDKRGLLAVHLNSLNHHQTGMPHALGPNPLDYLGIGKVQDASYLTPKYYIYQKTPQGWVRYPDHTDPVALPRYLGDVDPGFVRILSQSTGLYDFRYDEGHKHLGSWIDQAAVAVGR